MTQLIYCYSGVIHYRPITQNIVVPTDLKSQTNLIV